MGEPTKTLLKMKKFYICTLADLLEQGKKVAYLAANRKLNQKNINAKSNSLKKTGGNIVPMMFVEATKAVNDGLEVVDALSGEVVEGDAVKDYIVIIDGQHRFMAGHTDKVDPTTVYLYESYSDLPTLTLVSIANIDTNKWNGGDYAHGAAMAKPEDEGLKFIRQLADAGYPLNTVSLMATFSTNITSAKLAKIMAGDSVTVDVNRERCEKLLDVLKAKFEEKPAYYKHRYIWSAIAQLSSNSGWKPVCEALDALTSNEVSRLLAVKGDTTEMCVELIKRHLVA